jgi:cytoskeletal protein CcmA (bactofilin family)
MFFRRQKAAGNDNDREAAPATLIAAGTVIDGQIDCEGDVRVEGTVRGSLRAQRCSIAPGGTVEGDITADEVVVQGHVTGPVRARHVHLEDGASVEGDISSDTIAIDTGARLTGSVWQGPAASGAASALTHRDGPSLFSESLWEGTGGDGRALAAVKPRAAGGSLR